MYAELAHIANDPTNKMGEWNIVRPVTKTQIIPINGKKHIINLKEKNNG